MTAEQFTYWLQGFMELTTMNHLTTTQFQIVKDHLDLVFDKKTPDRNTVGWTPDWPVLPGTTYTLSLHDALPIDRKSVV